MLLLFFFFFFNDTATTEIYTLSLHDALPIWERDTAARSFSRSMRRRCTATVTSSTSRPTASGWRRVCRLTRSEEHTSELQSRQYLVCRLLLEKKKKISTIITNITKSQDVLHT